MNSSSCLRLSYESSETADLQHNRATAVVYELEIERLTFICYLSPPYHCHVGVPIRHKVASLLDKVSATLVRRDHSITKSDGTPRMSSNILFVSNQNYCPATCIDGIEQCHDFSACATIKISSWLIGQQHGRFVDKCARDRHSLLLATREFWWSVAHTIFKTDSLQRLLRKFTSRSALDTGIDEWHLHIVESGYTR